MGCGNQNYVRLMADSGFSHAYAFMEARCQDTNEQNNDREVRCSLTEMGLCAVDFFFNWSSSTLSSSSDFYGTVKLCPFI